MKTKRILVLYLVVWILSVLSFWLGASNDALAYSILVFYLILLITTIFLSIFIDKKEMIYWILFFGCMFMMANYCTFLLKNGITFNKINLPNISHMIPGIVCSIIGIIIGKTLRKH